MSSQHFKIVVDEKASGSPHVMKLWMGVRKGMLPVKYVRLIKASFCVHQNSWRSLDCHKVEVNLATLSFWDIVKFKTVVSVCLGQKNKRRPKMIDCKMQVKEESMQVKEVSMQVG